MINREFLQLAETYSSASKVQGWYLSEKLDGMRAFWDGGITRGMPVELIPFANLVKSGEGKTATGLWSRYGHPIFAPDYFLDSLPNFTLDGELYMGRGMFQTLMSVVKDHVPGPGWRQVKYMVLDAPPLETVFMEGRINNPNYKIVFNKAFYEWAKYNSLKLNNKLVTPRPFANQLTFLDMFLPKNDIVTIHKQTRLPNDPIKCDFEMNKVLAEVLALKGEGIILRNPDSYWFPKRMKHILKLKQRLDAEAVVVGYTSAELGKLHGKIGSLKVNYNGQFFDLSGLTDEEREFANSDSILWAISNPGQTAPDWVKSKYFPRGETVTFTYRELSDDGKPKEAAYLRKRVD